MINNRKTLQEAAEIESALTKFETAAAFLDGNSHNSNSTTKTTISTRKMPNLISATRYLTSPTRLLQTFHSPSAPRNSLPSASIHASATSKMRFTTSESSILHKKTTVNRQFPLFFSKKTLFFRAFPLRNALFLCLLLTIFYKIN